MSMSAKLFMNGRSQAIRWPAKLRINADEVLIEPMAQGYLLQPKHSPQNNLGDWLSHFYATTEPLPDDFLAERDDAPPQQRDWD